MTKPTRVLHIVYAMNTGGVESWLMNVYRHIDRNKIQFDFLVNTKEKAFFDDEIKALGGQILYAAPLSKPVEIFKKCKNIFKKNSYHAVHCHNVENATPVLIAAEKENVPVRIYHSHNDLNHKLLYLNIYKKLYLQWSHFFALRYANAFLAVSKSAGESLFKNQDYRLLSLGLELEKFNPKNEKHLSKKHFGLNENDFVVGHVGRFDTQKNHRFLVKIAKEMIKVNKNTKILCIGQGVLEDKIKKEVSEEGLEGHFVFAGLRNDVPEVMSHVMDAFLFPSLSEGLGLVLVEAQAAGLPIVCSDIIPDEALVNPDLVEKVSLSESAKEWSDRVLSLYEHRKEYNKQKAYDVVKASAFDLNKTVEELEKIWQN